MKKIRGALLTVTIWLSVLGTLLTYHFVLGPSISLLGRNPPHVSQWGWVLMDTAARLSESPSLTLQAYQLATKTHGPFYRYVAPPSEYRSDAIDRIDLMNALGNSNIISVTRVYMYGTGPVVYVRLEIPQTRYQTTIRLHMKRIEGRLQIVGAYPP